MSADSPIDRNSHVLRRLDLLIWAPTLFVLGGLRKKRLMPAQPRRIGVMMFEAIGDTLLASGIINSLRSLEPAPEIVLFASKGNLGALPLLGPVADIVCVPLTEPLAALRSIRQHPVDLMIDIGQWPRWYAVLSAVSRSAFTIGFRTPGQYRHWAYDSAVEHSSAVHESRNFLNLLKGIPGVQERASGLQLPAILARAPMRNEDTVLIHPWAGGFKAHAREWPTPRWVALIHWLAENGMEVIISGSPADARRADELVRACALDERVRSMAGRWNLLDLADALRHCRSVIAVNTGVMHLAGLLDAPVIGLHGPTRRARWGPLGARSIALAPENGVRAEYLNLGFEYEPDDGDQAMEALTLEQVKQALIQQLSDSDSLRRRNAPCAPPGSRHPSPP